ncbi:MAG: PadR family transcriptional regulator [Candidatus Dormibacteria bacterium]|jgi:DNA-binding PadR family transcriptional regulator
MNDGLSALGRYAGPATLVLASLADGPKHGYKLTQDIDEFAGVRLQPGTLYGAISRLENDGLIEAMGAEGRRLPYRLTAKGRAALHAQLSSQRQIANVGLSRLRSQS